MASISLALAACSSSAATAQPTANPNATGAAQASAAIPSATAAPTLALPSIAIPSIAFPSGSFAIPSFAIPSFSFPSEDKDLEARLPSSINGVAMTKYSWKGTSFLGSGFSSSQDLTDILTALGKSPNDLSIAFASDLTGGLQLVMGAFRVNGADGNALLTAFVTSTQKETPEDTISHANVGGKNVTEVADPTDTTNGKVYAYSNGDTLFYVQTPDETLAATALQAMP